MRASYLALNRRLYLKMETTSFYHSPNMGCVRLSLVAPAVLVDRARVGS